MTQTVDRRRGIEDLTGKIYKRWTVLEFAGKNKGRVSMWLVRCDCGTEKVVLSSSLKNGTSKSCGCLVKDWLSETKPSTKHGLTGVPEYKIWEGMWSRCTNPKGKDYVKYKERTPPDIWKDFSVFFKEMGNRPSVKHTIDRIDNDKPYGPGNCRWATAEEQSLNRKSNRYMTYLGQTKTISEWAKKLDIGYSTLRNRLDLGYSDEEALTKPIGERR